MAEEKKNVQTLKEAKNNVSLEGLLLEMESRGGESSNGREFLSAKLTIATNNDKSEQHRIELFSMKYKADGTENGIYNSLETVVNEFKSVADHGEEEADRVRTTTGKLGLNEYYGKDGNLRSFPQINATFINRVEAGEDYTPHAKFAVEMVVNKVTEEMDQEENETGRVKMNGYIPLYGGKVIPFDFVVNEDGSPYVEENYEKGNTVEVYGDIVNFKEKKEIEKEAAFGQNKVEVKYHTVREYKITGGFSPYDEDDAYDPKAIKQALSEREVHLEGLKEKAQNKDSGKKKRGGFDTGGGKKQSKKKEGSPWDSASSDMGDLPF